MSELTWPPLEIDWDASSALLLARLLWLASSASSYEVTSEDAWRHAQGLPRRPRAKVTP